MMSVDFTRETEAFRRIKPKLIQDYGSVWVIFVGDELKGHFGTYREAALYSLEHLADCEFLIRNTTEPPLQIPLVAVED